MNKRILICLLSLFSVVQGITAQGEYITDVMTITGNKSQTEGYKKTYKAQGWTVIDHNLNRGANGAYVYLLYKVGTSDLPITDFYIKSGSGNPESLTHNGRTYYLAPAEGSCDLNNGAGGDYIYLYYTKDVFDDNRAVTGITFNDTKSGAVGKNGDNSNGYDLNSGARGDYIYMHFTTECMTTQAIWCSGSKTLYFTNCLKHHVTGDTYNGQTVTKAWYEDDIIHMTSSPEWVKETGVKENVTSVKFEKSFKIVRPTNLSMWFFNFSQLTNIVGIENLNTSEVTSMAGMFWGCTALTSIDVNSFDMRSVKNISYMFQYCPKLTTIYCNESWSDISDGAAMFKDCTALKGAVAYDDNKTDNQMANPRTGYFLKKGTVFIAETTNPVSVTLNNATPYTHEAVNFTIIPEKDYYIEFLTVNGNTSRQKYPLTDNGDNSYTFTMPGEDVTINFICNPLLSFFTDVLIVTQDDDNLKSYKDKGWSVIKKDLDAGAGGYFVYLLYKTATNDDIDPSYITDFYLRTGAYPPDELTHNNRTYYRSEYAGIPDGNLNRTYANEDRIYLYYTKEGASDLRAISYVEINSNKDGALGANGDNSIGLDLNRGYGGEYIYMHVTKRDVPYAPQALWCKDNNTLYFTSEKKLVKVDDTYKGQKVTKMWYGEELSNTQGWKPIWLEGTDEVKNSCTRVVFDLSFSNVRPKILYQWFKDMHKLATIEGIQYLNTSETTSMKEMFDGCSSLTTLDLNGFDVSKVKTAELMFHNCENLQTIYCDSTWKIPDSDNMFLNCNKLLGGVAYDKNNTGCNMADPITGYFMKQWDLMVNYNEHGSVAFNTSKANAHDPITLTVTREPGYAYELTVIGNRSLKPLKDLALSSSTQKENGDVVDIYTFVMPTEDVTAKAAFGNTPSAVYCEGNSTLYFTCLPVPDEGEYYLGQTATAVWSGENVTNTQGRYPGWHNYWEGVKKVIFHDSFSIARPKTLVHWFDRFMNMETIEGIENLNTSEVSDMSDMFMFCQSLKSIDINGFDVSKLVTAEAMFNNCKNLTTIYCDATWDLADENSMEMFFECPKLKGAVAWDKSKIHGSMANPVNGYFTPKSTLVLKDQEDNSEQLARFNGKCVNVKYDRVLRATKKDDGTWESKAYSVCLPYNLDLTAEYESGRINVCKLWFVKHPTTKELKEGTGRYEFIFSNTDPNMVAGQGYIIIVNEGELSLNANTVTIENEEKEEDVWLWQGEGNVGVWKGTLRTHSNDECVQQPAYAMSSDGNFRYIDEGDSHTARMGAFRAGFFANEYKDRDIYYTIFKLYVQGEDDDDPLTAFPSDTFDGDNDNTTVMVTFINLEGNEQTERAKVVNGNLTTLDSGWWAVTEDVTNANRLVVNGDVNLILCDGTSFTNNKGTTVNNPNKLTVWGQSKGSGFWRITSPPISYAGIGGAVAPSGLITINGGSINVTGGPEAAGIGGGDGGTGAGTIVINGGTITAAGGTDGAAIGSSYAFDYRNNNNYNAITTVTITGGNITAKTPNRGSTGIGGGGYGGATVTILGGTINVPRESGSIGIGYGTEFKGDRSKSTVLLSYDDDIQITSFNYNGPVTLQKNFSDGTTIYEAGAVSDNSILADKTLMPLYEVELADKANNDAILRKYNGKMCNVTLQGRTLYCDEGWNLLCLPFSLSEAQLTDKTCPLYGATILSPTTSVLSDALSLYFSETTNGESPTPVVAGTPYLVKWMNMVKFIKNPKFKGVVLNNAPSVVETDYVNVVGSYSPINLQPGDSTLLTISRNGEVEIVEEPTILNASRWHLQLNPDLDDYVEAEIDDNGTITVLPKVYDIELKDSEDNSDVLANYNSRKVNVNYDRVLRATDNGDGKWSSRAYSVCLPYALDLMEEHLSGRIQVCKLWFIKDNKEFVFSHTYPVLEAGKAYLIVVNEGELALNAGGVILTDQASEGEEVLALDSTTVMGMWRGSLHKIESADAAAMLAYSLQTDGSFKRIRPDTPWAWWGAFRAMYCANEFTGNNVYKSLFRQWVQGDDDDNPFLEFPSDGFEGDTDIPDEDGIMHVVDSDGSHEYFDLQGRKLNSKPTTQGVYIERMQGKNGKKMMKK